VTSLPLFSANYGVGENILQRFKTWFRAYSRSFHGVNAELDYAADLKIAHTEKVQEIITRLAKSLGLEARLCRLAESCALFHDVGRFPQFKCYGTFSDNITENHALLSCKVLENHKILGSLDEINSATIYQSVKNHNLAELPEDSADEVTLFFTRLLRDADKIDVLRVVSEHYAENNGNGKGLIVLDLPDSETVSPEVLEAVKNKAVIRYEMLKTVNDFKLLQLSWIYDLNFHCSLEMLSDCGYCDVIIKTLPENENLSEIKENLSQCLSENILV